MVYSEVALQCCSGVSSAISPLMIKVRKVGQEADTYSALKGNFNPEWSGIRKTNTRKSSSMAFYTSYPCVPQPSSCVSYPQTSLKCTMSDIIPDCNLYQTILSYIYDINVPFPMSTLRFVSSKPANARNICIQHSIYCVSSIFISIAQTS